MDDPSQEKDNLTVPYSIRISSSEKEQWDQHAEEYHSGKLAKMIRASVTFCMNIGDLSEFEGPNKSSAKLLKTVLTPLSQVQSNVDNLSNDMNLIKSLLSQLLSQKTPKIQIHESVSSIQERTLTLEEIVEDNVYDYLEQTKQKVLTSELLDYLKETSVDCKRYFAKSEREFEGAALFNLMSIQEKVMNQLFEKTKDPIYKINGGSKYDF
ncbi:MAG: hypothetical protein IH840_04505 [Candidatus Heimdallarchaeota archaeon]|nr:hypothetical protein [Candidatus Heimdallarchaeota archaeon]